VLDQHKTTALRGFGKVLEMRELNAPSAAIAVRLPTARRGVAKFILDEHQKP